MKINLHDIADADIIKTLFAENPGVVIQVSDAHKDELKAFFDENGIGYAKIGYPAPELRKIIIKKDGFEHEDRKSTRLNSSHVALSRMPSSA